MQRARNSESRQRTSESVCLTPILEQFRLDDGFCEFLDKKITNNKSEYYIPDFTENLIKTGTGRVEVVPSPDSWFGVTYKEDKAIAQACVQKLIDQGVYPNKIW